MLEKRREPLEEERRIQSRFRRKPDKPFWELLPPHLHVLRQFAVLIHLCEKCLEFIFEQGTLLFHNVACFNPFGKFSHDVGVKRMRHSEFKNRDVV